MELLFQSEREKAYSPCDITENFQVPRGVLSSRDNTEVIGYHRVSLVSEARDTLLATEFFIRLKTHIIQSLYILDQDINFLA